MATRIKLFDKFYAGIVRDDKSQIVGALANAEEVDVFSNLDFIQAEQIMGIDTLPAATDVFAYTAADTDIVYAYGRETAGSRVRILSTPSGGTDNPVAFTTLFTSADATNLASVVSDFKFFRTTEATNPTSLYYIKGTGALWYIARFNIGSGTEQRWDGTAWAATGAWDVHSQLTGLDGSFMRPTMKVIFGELFICQGQFIAKVASSGAFTEKAFTLPKEWEAVDLIPVSDLGLILARNRNRAANFTRSFWWDLTSVATFDDSFDLPIGGPQWILNYKELVFIFCASDGIGKLFASGAFPGAKPKEIDHILFQNLGIETSTQPVSSPKMIGARNGIIYFGLFKTDKTGIYALGQLDGRKPFATLLSKRFHTTDYASHFPISLLLHGPNYFASFNDGATHRAMRCHTRASPARSSLAVVETTWQDFNEPYRDKNLERAFIETQQLPTGTSLALSVASDYSSVFTSVRRADDSIFNTANGIFGILRPTSFNNKKVYKVRVNFTSSGVNSPRLVSIGLRYFLKPYD